MRVLVTNSSGAKGLIITRSLGKKNIEVVNTDCIRFSAAFCSRYSKKHFLSPSPLDSPNEFIKVILEYVKKNKIDIILPVNSAETLLISQHKERFLPYTKVPFEDYSKMIKLHDKGELAKVAKELNILIPKTYNIFEIDSIEKLAISIKYPVVIKLKNSTSSVGINYAFSQEDLISKYRDTVFKYKLDKLNYPLIQEYIPGTGYGVSLLMNHGELRAIFTHKRLREYPITGGPSTLRISIRHPEMEKIAVKLLEHFNWHGVAMVEFKLDRRSNKPYLIEVNPRFWGSINQAIASGVDFPYLLYKMTVEGDIQPVLDYKLGVKTRFLMNDFRAMVSHLKHSKSRNQIIREILRFDGMHDDVLYYKDLLPIFFFVHTNLKEFLKRY